MRVDYRARTRSIQVDEEASVERGEQGQAMGVGETWRSNPFRSVPFMQGEETLWHAGSVATNEMRHVLHSRSSY